MKELVNDVLDVEVTQNNQRLREHRR